MISGVSIARSFGQKGDGREDVEWDRLQGHESSDKELLRREDTELKDSAGAPWTYMTVLFCFWRDSPQWARASSFTRFLDHTHNDAQLSLGLFWTSDQLVADTSTWQYIQHSRQTSFPQVGFEPPISAGERPQTAWPMGPANMTVEYIDKWLCTSNTTIFIGVVD